MLNKEVLYKDIRYAGFNERNVLDVYLPEKDEFDVLIYFHGGGLEHGDKEAIAPIAKALCRRGIAVAVPNYSLYPETSYPDYLEDAAAAVEWVKKNISEYGTVNKVFVGGSSAGAYITAMLAYNTELLAKYNIDKNDISGYIINSAQMTTHFNVLRERGICTSKIVVDEAAPIHYLDEGMIFPNVLILMADNDMPCRYEQNMVFIRTLKIFGCPEEKLELIIMKDSKHCSYDNSEEYHNILCEFIGR